MSALLSYLVGFFLSIYTAISEKSIKAGREFWLGWRDTTSFVHKDDSIIDTKKERNDKVFDNSLDYLNRLERMQKTKEK